MSAAPSEAEVVWKILLESEARSLPATEWRGTQMDQGDGFIHLSTTSQVLGTLKRFYAPPVQEAVLCAIAPSALRSSQASQLKYEPAPDGAGTFPHLYATLDPKTQIQSFWTLTRPGPDGEWDWDSKRPYTGLPGW